MKQEDRLKKIREELDQQESKILSKWASLSSAGVRRAPEKFADHRQTYAVDCDRILHSKAYTRYIDKTQVFYMIDNDHITHRVLHVQLVSKIARTIGRFLGLNEDLIEAIALGHDLGHPPFGHEGERILSKICQQNNIGHFLHNVQSVRFLDKLEKGGAGTNLTLQVLDGILCHDGEIHSVDLTPLPLKNFEEFDQKLAEKMASPLISIVPLTLEGCVVRMADTIAYIGRDIEDAITLGLIKRADIPTNCQESLGKTNGTIVYTLVTDLIANSYKMNKIIFSREVSEALLELKKFNYSRIYLNPYIKKGLDQIKECYIALFASNLENLEKEDTSSLIYQDFFSKRSTQDNSEATTHPERVRDYLAGMTDNYFLAQAKALGCHIPKKI